MGIKVDVKKHAAAEVMSERDKDLGRIQCKIYYAVWLEILEYLRIQK